MAKINDLTQGNIGEVARQQHRDQYATPLNGSSVGHGGQRFYGTGQLRVENEGLYVVGVADISGTLNVSGALNVSGSTVLSGSTTIAGPTGITGQLTIQGATSVTGPLTVTGVTKLNGATDVGGAFTVTGVTKLNGNTTVGGNLEIVSGGLFKAGATEIRPDGSAKFGLFDIASNGNLSSKGTLDIDGVTTLKKDLNVTGDGKINVGQMQLEPANGGQLNWLGGSLSASSALGTLLIAGTLDVVSQGVLDLQGGTSVAISAPRVDISGVTYFSNAVRFNNAYFYLPALPTTTLKPNLYVNPTSGVLSRSTAVI